MRIEDLIYRDEEGARDEASAGMHHALFWVSTFMKMLSSSPKTMPRLILSDGKTGSHHFRFVDPVTGLSYDVRVKPTEVKR